jgi:hypothetical protein
MISVIEVYNAVRELANKDQKGFVTPAVFNSFADVAQQNAFSTILGELTQAKALRLGQRDPGAGESVYRGVEDDLSEYIREQKLESSREPNLTGDSNLFKKPEDFYKLISMRVEGDERTPIELVYRPDQMSHITSSNLSAPTELFPVALVSRSIEVFPTDVGSVIMTYYRQPASRIISNQGLYSKGDVDYDSSPRFSVSATAADGFYTPDINNSRDFDLPERFKGLVIAEICKMIGVRLRDSLMAQYGQTQSN